MDHQETLEYLDLRVTLDYRELQDHKVRVELKDPQVHRVFKASLVYQEPRVALEQPVQLDLKAVKEMLELQVQMDHLAIKDLQAPLDLQAH